MAGVMYLENSTGSFFQNAQAPSLTTQHLLGTTALVCDRLYQR